MKVAPNLPALGGIDENEAKSGVDEEYCFDRIVDKDFRYVFDTPEVQRYLSGLGKWKESADQRTLSLLDCPSASTWEQKCVSVRHTVPLVEHPVQQSLLNSFVKVVSGLKPLQAHKG